ncbi:hypothetical protein MNKW57_22750 [Biformimicrobium ophioploci]|uniref:DUF4380 domain-containing protein n=1 Tax=Biformimicrobium ophioploci TaxID=3036711 RepID=A0ABQ6M0R7_9GAMM|nr:hypothetical protein MNKW57_22750 [Microbulbifer sp. NKW57]
MLWGMQAGFAYAEPAPEAGRVLTLREGVLTVSIDPALGGRVTGLSLGNHEFLSGSDVHANNFGSTFWLSPQTIWNWPPVAAHDSGVYTTLEESPRKVTMASQAGAGAIVEKSVDVLAPDLIRLDYRVTAQKPFPELAAWQISRVANRGLAFAPVTPETVQVVRGAMDISVDDSGIMWLALDPDAPLREGKVIANGSEGWLAFVDSGHLYLKIYPLVNPAHMATGEGDIELYLSGEKPYLELELQSAAQALAEGETLDWFTYWLVEPVPAGIELTRGSSELIAYVRGRARQIQQMTSVASHAE